jgi:hypothetical protein
VRGGPSPDDYFSFFAKADRVAERRTGRAPEHADVVFVYRPAEELRQIVEQARRLGTTASARSIVEDAGLSYFAGSSIVEALRKGRAPGDDGDAEISSFARLAPRRSWVSDAYVGSHPRGHTDRVARFIRAHVSARLPSDRQVGSGRRRARAGVPRRALREEFGPICE